jgi:hypothetical protein
MKLFATFINLPATLYPTCLLRCGLPFRTLHNCHLQQGGAVENIDNLPTDFSPSGFTVIQNSRDVAFIHLRYPINSEEVDFTSVFVILQDALQSVFQQLVSHVKGIKVSISLKTSESKRWICNRTGFLRTVHYTNSCQIYTREGVCIP